MAVGVNKYTCWGPDKEDLTTRVEAALKTKANWGTLRAATDADPGASFDTVERVIVYCSTSGHKNVFSFER